MTPGGVAAVVLAAGMSRRMEGSNKLLAAVGGVPIVARVVSAMQEAGASPVVVVVGHEGHRVRAALAGRAVRFVENGAYREGLGASLRVGMAAIEASADGADPVDAALVALGDMPWIRAEHARRVMGAFEPGGPKTICVPVHAGRRGHPILWARRHFAEMRDLAGDVGARGLLERHAHAVLTVPIDDAGILVDVDTPEMLARAAAAGRSA